MYKREHQLEMRCRGHQTDAKSRNGFREVNCEKLDQDRYGRVVSRCFSNGNHLGETMVVKGLASHIGNIPVNTCRWSESPRACSEECGRVNLLHLGNGEEENGSDTKIADKDCLIKVTLIVLASNLSSTGRALLRPN